MVTQDFNKIIRAESFKLRKQKTSYIVPVAVMLLGILLFVVLEFTTRRNWIGVPSGHFVAASVISWIGNVMMLLVVLMTSFIVSQEFALGTIKSTLVRPVTRGQWYTAKVFTAAVSLSVLFLCVVVVVVALAAVRLGLTDLTEKNYVVHTARSLTFRLVLSVGLTVFALWAVTVFVALVAGVFNHPGGAIAAALGAGVLMVVLGAFPAARPFLLTTYMSAPWEQMVAMSKGLPLPYEWGQLVWRTLAGAGAWMVLGFVVGQHLIRKKEITS
ncbi:MAG: ABC transporter permease [Candidatus Latescibacterota bacterium]|nr:MAG: ABC transporter permease [Candidatus Latescibacterota bacterium]